jgi:hypothetical protein
MIFEWGGRRAGVGLANEENVLVLQRERNAAKLL